MLPNKRISLIKRFDGSRGSIVLEAAMVMPAFIMVMFLFIYMIQMTLVLGQMHTVAANAVKQISAHIYPVALAVEEHSAQPPMNSQRNYDQSFGWEMPDLSLSDWAGQYAASLPPPLSEWIMDAVAEGDEPLQDIKNSAAESVLDPVIKPLLIPFLEGTALNEKRLHVVHVAVPNLKTGQTPYFGLELSYELPIKVPFSNRRIVLQTKSEERLWIGDTGELNQNNGEGETGLGQAAVILAKPDPAYAGHHAAIKAKIAPGSAAKLTVYYKSGVSQAKYLGEAVANGEGIVEWKWLVGGNTTPGIWTFVIETQDGRLTTAEFSVESPSRETK